MPRKKKVNAHKRTPGFTTIEKEVHDLLDTVRPIAERVYRKLHQRINIKRGDHKAFPTFEQLQRDTRITNHTSLAKAIKELEDVGLIVVERSYNPDLQRKNVNVYKVVPTQELSHVQIVPEPRTKSKNPTYKSVRITRMKRTRMNVTKTKKGTLQESPQGKGKSANADANTKKEKGHVQNRTGSMPVRVTQLSADEIRERQAVWEAKQSK